MKEGRKKIYIMWIKGRLNSYDFQSFWAFPRSSLHFGWSSCKTPQNITFSSYIGTKFKSAPPAKKAYP